MYCAKAHLSQFMQITLKDTVVLVMQIQCKQYIVGNAVSVKLKVRFLLLIQRIIDYQVL